jgi:hypothetical protein
VDIYRPASVLDGGIGGIGAGFKDVVRDNVSCKSLHLAVQVCNIYGLYLENTGKLVANEKPDLIQITQ